MILRKLSILNYRNIREASLSFSPKMNCLIGHNGAGKTNVLDAIFYLSFCKSMLNTVDQQLLLHGEEFFLIDGTYENERGEEERVGCGVRRGAKKVFRRNGKAYRRFSEHLGLIPLVFVGPGDISLIEGGSEERRRLMDMVIAQYDKDYVTALNRYGKALQQRNVLLRAEEEPDGALMELLEEEMAEQGMTIFLKRKSFVDEFSPVFQRIYNEIAQNDEVISLQYTSHGQRGPLLEVIQRDRAKDRIMGYSLHGVHRDDLEMSLNGYDMKREGSQGQHKTYAIALKLAQFDFLRRTSSATTPLLLLDDVFDKLDASRVEQIVRLVSKEGFGQIFITDTNREHLDKILQSSSDDYCLFQVDGGEIKRIGGEGDV